MRRAVARDDLVCRSGRCNGLERPRSSKVSGRLFGRSVLTAAPLHSERLSLSAETDLQSCIVLSGPRTRRSVIAQIG